MPATPSTEELQRAVGVICKVIGQIPYFHIFENSLAQRFDTTSTIGESLQAMTHNAALDSTLINVRCFNEFFKPDGRKDDIRAYHYPGIFMQPFLTADQEQEIHKHLAHITLTRTSLAAKPWTIDGFIGAGLQQGVAFLRAIEATFPLPTEADRAEVRGVAAGAERIIASLLSRLDSEA